MKKSNLRFILPLLPLLSAPVARALDIDTLFPSGVPGFGRPFTVVYERNLLAQQAAGGITLGACTIAPSLAATAGYDSAPNGATGSALATESPSLLISDEILGFGAYAAQTGAFYPQDSRQNTKGYTLGLGEKLPLPTQTITLAAAQIQSQETGFALNTVTLTRPISFSITQLRAKDDITAGLFTLSPDFELNHLRFPEFASQNRTDQRESLILSYAPGGPLTAVLAWHATQSLYRDNIFNAATQAALAGLDDSADGLWNIQLLAGAAQRRPRAGKPITAPVLEAGLDWLPDGLDQIRLTAAREIDDPDQVSADAYTLTQFTAAVTHDYLRTLTLSANCQLQNAAFFSSALREILVTANLAANWQINPSVALTASYAFNGRQANRLRAANENILTLGATWTL